MPADHDYDTLASVYDWIVPEALTTPRGSVEAFLPYLDDVPAGARVLDCAAGAGPLAVGLAQRGFAVTARPHWGKVFHADAAAVGPLYERMGDFRALAERLDARGAFRNAWLERHVLGG